MFHRNHYFMNPSVIVMLLWIWRGNRQLALPPESITVPKYCVSPIRFIAKSGSLRECTVCYQPPPPAISDSFLLLLFLLLFPAPVNETPLEYSKEPQFPFYPLMTFFGGIFCTWVEPFVKMQLLCILLTFVVKFAPWIDTVPTERTNILCIAPYLRPIIHLPPTFRNLWSDDCMWGLLLSLDPLLSGKRDLCSSSYYGSP